MAALTHDVGYITRPAVTFNNQTSTGDSTYIVGTPALANDNSQGMQHIAFENFSPSGNQLGDAQGFFNDLFSVSDDAASLNAKIAPGFTGQPPQPQSSNGNSAQPNGQYKDMRYGDNFFLAIISNLHILADNNVSYPNVFPANKSNASQSLPGTGMLNPTLAQGNVYVLLTFILLIIL